MAGQERRFGARSGGPTGVRVPGYGGTGTPVWRAVGWANRRSCARIWRGRDGGFGGGRAGGPTGGRVPGYGGAGKPGLGRPGRGGPAALVWPGCGARARTFRAT